MEKDTRTGTAWSQQQPPSWSEMLGRMAAVGYQTARGVLRYRDPDGEQPEGVQRFAYADPDRWRVEDEHGLMHLQDGEWLLVRDEAGRLQRLPQRTSAWNFRYGHPWTLLGADDPIKRFSRRDDFSVPTGPAVPVRVAGRMCWEFVLAPPPRKPHPLRVAVDDRTGTVLRMAVPELDSVIVAEEFEPDVELPLGTFVWDGPLATDWADELVANAEVRHWLEREPLPVPCWWPGGVGYEPMKGNPDTGAYSVMLTVPGEPILGRWPSGGEPPQYWSERTAGRHMHEWCNDGWQWALAVDDPLPADELARVIASIRPSGASR